MREVAGWRLVGVVWVEVDGRRGRVGLGRECLLPEVAKVDWAGLSFLH